MGYWNPDGKGAREIPDPEFRAKIMRKFWITVGIMAVYVFGTLAVILAIPERQ